MDRYGKSTTKVNCAMIFPAFFHASWRCFFNATQGDLPLPRTDALELQVLEKAVQHKVMPEACPVITSCSKVGKDGGAQDPSDQNVGMMGKAGPFFGMGKMWCHCKCSFWANKWSYHPGIYIVKLWEKWVRGPTWSWVKPYCIYCYQIGHKQN